MDITKTIEKSSVLLTLRGPLDRKGAEALEKEFRSADFIKIRVLELDFRDVPMIDSAGIGKLLMIHKELAIQGGNVRILNASDDICLLLTELNLKSLFGVK
jgi:anti-anti-sigma factor